MMTPVFAASFALVALAGPAVAGEASAGPPMLHGWLADADGRMTMTAKRGTKRLEPGEEMR